MALSDRNYEFLQLHFSNLEKIYGRPIGKQFAATPSIEKKLIEKLVEHGGWFAAHIFFRLVNLKQGQKIAMSLSARTSSTTNTAGKGGANKRIPRRLLDLADDSYECTQVNDDTLLNYDDLDDWAEFAPEFIALYNQLLRSGIFDSLIIKGWNGVSRADDSDIATYPNMDDVIVGWLQKIRVFNTGSQYLLGDVGNPIELGGATYTNLDMLVNALKQQIAIHKRENLVAYISDDLVGEAGGHYYAAGGDKASEKVYQALNNGIVLETFGGLRTFVPPFFPAGTILLTPMQNLQHYTQRGSIRRTVKDMPEDDGIAEFQSSNQSFVVYDEERTFLCEGITIAA